ncbi:hypothetical protein PHJA_002282500 [Phtheirospermum japonicum]|uniref:Uncharacterized protein n=1 Tax=Phtheirospermum japonicum TaxID=374723 RepID=A0A830D2C6_9LAMI|nr:hypothetical protein PHJA_002282500 [Phtheirospermum japonicum]
MKQRVAMKLRVEAVESNSQGPCKKHPISSPVGVCAFCLNDKLVQLQRSNHRTSSSTTEFDCVGNISIFEEYEKHLRRSNSSCAEAKKGNGLWRIRDFFGRIIKNKGGEKGNFVFSGDQSEISVSDKLGVSSSSRSRSFSTSKISDSHNFYGSNRMELCGIYENYCVPKRSAFQVEESDFSTIESDFIDLKLDLL